MNEIERLSQLYLFRAVPPAALRELIILAPPTHIAAGHEVFAEGAAADVALLLLSGRLIAAVGKGAYSREVGDIKPGEIVGEQGLFVPGGQRSARVVAAEPSVALLVTPKLMDHAAANPAIVAIEQHLLGTLARRIRRTNQAIQGAWKAAPLPDQQGTPRKKTLRDRFAAIFSGG